MNAIGNICLSIMPLFFLTTCRFSNFYEDPDDPGLSRFTARGYNVSSCYINGMAYASEGLEHSLLYKNSSGTTVDTLTFEWRNLYPSNPGQNYYNSIPISYQWQVPATFDKKDLLALNGKKIENAVLLSPLSSQYQLTGKGSLYFVSVTQAMRDTTARYIKLSGLFDGNIGDSLQITKGRFDFEIDEKNLNF